jgi:hypothetical protein
MIGKPLLPVPLAYQIFPFNRRMHIPTRRTPDDHGKNDRKVAAHDMAVADMDRADQYDFGNSAY